MGGREVVEGAIVVRGRAGSLRLGSRAVANRCSRPSARLSNEILGEFICLVLNLKLILLRDKRGKVLRHKFKNAGIY